MNILSKYLLRHYFYFWRRCFPGISLCIWHFWRHWNKNQNLVEYLKIESYRGNQIRAKWWVIGEKLKNTQTPKIARENGRSQHSKMTGGFCTGWPILLKVDGPEILSGRSNWDCNSKWTFKLIFKVEGIIQIKNGRPNWNSNSNWTVKLKWKFNSGRSWYFKIQIQSGRSNLNKNRKWTGIIL